VDQVRAGLQVLTTILSLPSLSHQTNHRLENDHRATIPALIAHLHTHAQYQHLFEDPYLVDTTAYYTAESAALAESLHKNGREFLRRVSLRVEEEVGRAKDLLPVGSWAVVRGVTMEALLGKQLEWLAKTGMSCLLGFFFLEGKADWVHSKYATDGWQGY